MLIFVRTKIATQELAEKLQARGFSSAALNGDISQQQRERTLARLKQGTLDILVATDVAARGLDVDRISHVVNFDIPPTPNLIFTASDVPAGWENRVMRSCSFHHVKGTCFETSNAPLGRKSRRWSYPPQRSSTTAESLHSKQRITDALATEELEPSGK